MFYVLCLNDLVHSAVYEFDFNVNASEILSDNITIEWNIFSILDCSKPMPIIVSVFQCLPIDAYVSIVDTLCLYEQHTDFDETHCLATTMMDPISTTIVAQVIRDQWAFFIYNR
jgi:hypothetical protein